MVVPKVVAAAATAAVVATASAAADVAPAAAPAGVSDVAAVSAKQYIFGGAALPPPANPVAAACSLCRSMKD